ncbi:MAG: hypothetical protein GY862_32110 [Gammaproteobacteria bacterium]|nr:hypothetical protein [Gammaproteobacteria bacterium]
MECYTCGRTGFVKILEDPHNVFSPAGYDSQHREWSGAMSDDAICVILTNEFDSGIEGYEISVRNKYVEN